MLGDHVLSQVATALSARSLEAPLLAILSCLAGHALPTAQIGCLVPAYLHGVFTGSPGHALLGRLPKQCGGTALAALQTDHPWKLLLYAAGSGVTSVFPARLGPSNSMAKTAWYHGAFWYFQRRGQGAGPFLHGHRVHTSGHCNLRRLKLEQKALTPCAPLRPGTDYRQLSTPGTSQEACFRHIWNCAPPLGALCIIMHALWLGSQNVQRCAAGWSPDRGSGQNAATREKLNMPALVETGQ